MSVSKRGGPAVLARSYIDTVTGFHGVATGRAEYISGPPRVGLETVLKNGEHFERWFDESRLDNWKGDREET